MIPCFSKIFRVVLAITTDDGDTDVSNFQVTVQGLLLKGQTYRWMQYIQYPEINDSLNPVTVKAKVSIVDFRCHSSCKLRVEANGYNQFRKSSYNTAALEA